MRSTPASSAIKINKLAKQAGPPGRKPILGMNKLSESKNDLKVSPRPDLLARRIVRDIMIYTRGQPRRWVPMQTVERRLVLKDDKATDAALTVAIEKGWLLLKADHSIGLTDSGRQLTKS